MMRDKINVLGFCKAEAIFSGTSGSESMNQFERNRVLSDFASGDINVICAISIWNIAGAVRKYVDEQRKDI